MVEYDIIIVGGGISGLYSAYKIKQLNPKLSILVLEKQDYIGGRAQTLEYEGTTILSGAGIGRKQKDFRLMKLLKELDISYGEFPVKPNYANNFPYPNQMKNQVKKMFSFLKTSYTEEDKNKHFTFKEYVNSKTGPMPYDLFKAASGYSDYENEDAYDTLFHYGFDDNFANWTGLSIDWNELTKTLCKKIGVKNIKGSQDVQKIRWNETTSNYSLYLENKPLYLSKKVIIATTIEGVKHLVPGANRKDSIYSQIHAQPFLRIYGKFSKHCQTLMKDTAPHTIVVNGPVHKIIPMNPDLGVYMIAYTDNYGATFLKKYSKNNKDNREALCRILEKSLGLSTSSLELDSIEDFFWKEGTHYYEPLHGPYKNRQEFIKQAQRPMSNMLVVGEMISLNQGWVEGALHSVDNVITDKWINE
jgi:hypothetical protein